MMAFKPLIIRSECQIVIWISRQFEANYTAVAGT
jgi:hypothetical protein